MCPLPAVATVEPERHQRRAGIRARLDRRGGIRAVVAEDVADVRDALLDGEPAQVAGEVVVERSMQVGHRDGDSVLDGALPRCTHGIVDRDQFGDIRRQAVTGAMADLLGDGHHDGGPVRQHDLVRHHVAGQRERDRDPGFAVEVSRHMKPSPVSSGLATNATKSPTLRPRVSRSALDETLRSTLTSTLSQSVGWVSISSP